MGCQRVCRSGWRSCFISGLEKQQVVIEGVLEVLYVTGWCVADHLNSRETKVRKKK